MLFFVLEMGHDKSQYFGVNLRYIETFEYETINEEPQLKLVMQNRHINTIYGRNAITLLGILRNHE